MTIMKMRWAVAGSSRRPPLPTSPLSRSFLQLHSWRLLTAGTVPLRPVAGAALLFPHGRWHEGREVQEGRKVVLRTDLPYQAVPDHGWRR